MSPDGGTARLRASAPDDHALWAAARDGDRDAFATLYRRHADAVWQQAYRLTGSRTSAEDVVAETFYTAWRRDPRCGGRPAAAAERQPRHRRGARAVCDSRRAQRRAAEYPPTTTWRNALTGPVDGGRYDRLLEIDEAFGCVLTPESVTLSGVTGTSVGGLQLVRISSNMVFVLNPERLWFTLGNQPRQWVGHPVMAVALPEENDLRIATYERGDLPGSEPGGPGDNAFRWSGPVPELGQAVTVVDRVLPRRADTLDDAELANCVVNEQAPTITGAGNELWTPVGRHDVGDGAPTALVARIGDIAAGFCLVDPSRGPVFAGDRLSAEIGPGGVLIALRTEAALGVVLIPPDEEVTRVEIAPTADPAGSRACTILDGLVVCTLEMSSTGADPTTEYVITAYAAGSTQGQVLYPR